MTGRRGGTPGWVLVVVAVALLVLGSLADVERRERDVSSTHTAAPGGLRALYLAAEELGIRVGRWERPLDDEEAGRPAALAVATPIGLRADEVDGLRGWVEAGGRLLYVVTRDGDAFARSVGLVARSVPPGSSAEMMRRDPAGLSDPRAAALLEGTPAQVPAFERRMVRGDGCPPATSCEQPPDAPVVTPLLAAGDRLGAALVTLGAGRVVVVSDVEPISNRMLRGSGVAVLALRALADVAEDDVVWFDEYHHGYDARGALWSRAAMLLVGTPPGWAVLHLAAVGLLALAAAGVRFGSPLPAPAAPGRSSLEHVAALAAAYEAVGASRRAGKLLVDELALRLDMPSAAALRARLAPGGVGRPGHDGAATVVLRQLAGEDVPLPALCAAVDALLAEDRHADRTPHA